MISDDLRNWVKTSILKSENVTNLLWKELSTDGDGYWSIIYIISFDEVNLKGTKRKSLIAKLLPNVEGNMKNEAVFAFKTEVKIYSEILPHIRKLFLTMADEVEYFSPEYFGEHRGEALILENLKDSGYKSPIRKSRLDYEHMCLVIKNLSLLHALSYVALQKGLIDHSQIPFYAIADNLDNSLSLVNSGLKTLCFTMFKSWGVEWHELARKIRDMQPTSHRRLQEVSKPMENGFNVLNHGDCWTSNFMFQYEEGRPVKNKFFDFQFAHYNSYAIDLGNLLLTSFTYENKKTYFDSLIKIYVEGLHSVLSGLPNVHIPDIEEVKQEMKRVAFQRFIIMAVFLPIMVNTSDQKVDMKEFFKGDFNEPSQQMIDVYTSEIYITEAKQNLQEFLDYGIF